MLLLVRCVDALSFGKWVEDSSVVEHVGIKPLLQLERFFMVQESL